MLLFGLLSSNISFPWFHVTARKLLIPQYCYLKTQCCILFIAVSVSRLKSPETNGPPFPAACKWAVNTVAAIEFPVMQGGVAHHCKLFKSSIKLERYWGLNSRTRRNIEEKKWFVTAHAHLKNRSYVIYNRTVLYTS
jgi:hypothetical protein